MVLQALRLALLLPIMVVSAASAEVLTDELGCQRLCGEISVPYPFGFGKPECFKDAGFSLTCDQGSNPPSLIHGINIPVLNVSLENGTAIIQIDSASVCDAGDGFLSEDTFDQAVKFSPEGPFTFSGTENMFTTVGCDVLGLVSERDAHKFATGCLSMCSDSIPFGDPTGLTSCSGVGCCQTPIPSGLKTFNITLQSINQNTNRQSAQKCSYGFLARSNFNLKETIDKVTYTEIVMDWAIGKKTCQQAEAEQESICGPNAKCYDSTNGPGYRCSCKEGYEGNPYTRKGCKDIDECLPSYGNKYPCRGTCKNKAGNYTCHCSFGHGGDGKRGCRLKTVTIVTSAIGLSILLAALALSLFWFIQKKLQERNHRTNGGLLLDHLSVKSFKETQLEKATKNFDAKQLLGEGGNGWVYRGTLPDTTEIAVKKSKIVDQNQIEQFLNEADIVSKINHKNVVKLLGVCLQSRVPMLVYEFVPNGTLYHHIHGHISRVIDSWQICLKIASETARALDYMHSLAYPPIIHRDIKSANILLDAAYTAKVADFGASKLIPLDRTLAPTPGQGTMGYLDPEYLQTGELTTKSDVYGYGVVLMELLTKQKPIFRAKSGETISLVKVFTSAVKNNKLAQVLKVAEATDRESEQIHFVAELAIKCVTMPSTDRPTMAEVADELNGLSKQYRNFPIEGGGDYETVSLLDDQDLMSTSVTFEIE